MLRHNKLIKDTLLYAVAQFGSSFLSFIMLPVYTFYFQPEEYGLWDMMMTVVTLLTPIITLELVAASYRWLLDEKNETKRQTIISTSFFMICRNLLIFNLISLVLQLCKLNIPFLLLLTILINTSIFASFLQQCARGLEANLLFALSGVLQSALIVLLNIIFMFVFHLRLDTLFYSLIIAQVLTISLIWRRLGMTKYIFIKKRSERLKSAFLSYSIPIIPGAISWWIMTMSDRFMIHYFLGIQYNGIFAIANKVPAIVLIVNNIFFLAWKDSAITQFHTERRNDYYSIVFKHFFRLIALTIILLTLAAKPIFTFIISDQFLIGWRYVGLLLIGTLFHCCSLFWSAGYHGAKETKIIFVTSVVGAFLNIVFNFTFLPVIGLYAVGLSTAIAFLISWISRILYSQKHFTITINYIHITGFIFAITIANIIPFILSLKYVLGILAGLSIFFCLYGFRLISRHLNWRKSHNRG